MEDRVQLLKSINSKLNEFGAELQCVVCLSLVEHAHTLPCNHAYCEDCIKFALRSKSQCPICKHTCFHRDIRVSPLHDNLVQVFTGLKRDLEAINEIEPVSTPTKRRQSSQHAPTPLSPPRQRLMVEKARIEAELASLDHLLTSCDTSGLDSSVATYIQNLTPSSIPAPLGQLQQSRLSGQAESTSLEARPADSPITQNPTAMSSPAPHNTPSTKETRRSSMRLSDVILMGTGLSRAQLTQLKQLASQLNLTIVTNTSKRVTHVVTETRAGGRAPRTVKYAAAILLGQWVMSFSWVEACLEAGELVDEEEFEVLGDSHAQWGPRNSRLAHAAGNALLFTGVSLFLQGSSSKDLRPLLRWSAATLQKKAIKSRSQAQSMYCIVCDVGEMSVDSLSRYKVMGYTVVTDAWVWESISHYDLQEVTKYLVTDEMCGG